MPSFRSMVAAFLCRFGLQVHWDPEIESETTKLSATPGAAYGEAEESAAGVPYSYWDLLECPKALVISFAMIFAQHLTGFSAGVCARACSGPPHQHCLCSQLGCCALQKDASPP